MNEFLMKIFAIWLCCSLVAKADTASKLKACDKAVSACEALVEEQDKDIALLKSEVEALEEKATEAEEGPAVSVWVFVGVALVTGGVGAAFSIPALIGLSAGVGTTTLGLSLK